MLQRHSSWAVASILLAALGGCAHADAPTGGGGGEQPSPLAADPADAAVETLQIAPPPDAGARAAVAAVTTAPVTGVGAAGGNGDSALDPAIFACHADADCTAVRKNGCCNHGELEAVAASQVDAYKASFSCRAKVMCPQFLRRDLRVAACDMASSRCQMVAPTHGPTH